MKLFRVLRSVGAPPAQQNYARCRFAIGDAQGRCISPKLHRISCFASCKPCSEEFDDSLSSNSAYCFEHICVRRDGPNERVAK